MFFKIIEKNLHFLQKYILSKFFLKKIIKNFLRIKILMKIVKNKFHKFFCIFFFNFFKILKTITKFFI